MGRTDRKRKRAMQEQTHAQHMDLVDYFSANNNELIVRRWELLTLFAYVSHKERVMNRWWRVLLRLLTGKPILRFSFFDLVLLELDRRRRDVQAGQRDPS